MHLQYLELPIYDRNNVHSTDHSISADIEHFFADFSFQFCDELNWIEFHQLQKNIQV
jgi:hypothetical protein